MIFKDYASYYDLIYKDKPYKQEAEFVCDWANKPKTILDLGCGTGRHIYYLAPKVEQIIGIDASLEMLSLAYIHTKKFNNVRYIFNKTDKRLLDLPKVDCATALFNVVGYIGLEECLKYLPLKKNGLFIFDIWDSAKVHSYSFGRKCLGNHWYRESLLTRRNNNQVQVDIAIFKKKRKHIYEEQKVYEKHLLTAYSKQDIEKIGKRFNYKIVDIKPTENWSCWFKLQRL